MRVHASTKLDRNSYIWKKLFIYFYIQLRYSELGYFASGQLLNICITIAGEI